MTTTTTIDDIDVKSLHVLMRVDFNVPVDDAGNITDDRRIAMALPTIRSVLDRGGRLVLMSHCGRPAGTGFEPRLSLAPVARRLSTLLGNRPVTIPGNNAIDDATAAAVSAMNDGDVILLENLRFNAGEKAGDESFAARLAAYGDVYCNDAFGTAHRSDASMVAVPRAMQGKPRVAGRLLQKELQFLARTLEAPAHPFIAMLGGAKVSDKMKTIVNLAARVDTILIGGAMAYTFLKARGINIGSSLVESTMIDEAGRMLDQVAASNTTVMLPVDHVTALEISTDAPTEVTGPDIRSGLMGLDIGPKTVDAYVSAIDAAATVVWNGPMGVFETPPFDVGTRAVAAAMARVDDRGGVSIVGGGDSAAAVQAFGLAEQFSHVSTGGGASLKMLEGEQFASVGELDRH